MSWLLGNSDTSFMTDLSSLWTNATTGELTPSQLTEINTSETQNLLACGADQSTWNQSCKDTYNAITQDNQSLTALNPKCALNVPVFGCFQSWGNAIAAAFVIVFGLFFLLQAILHAPSRRG